MSFFRAVNFKVSKDFFNPFFANEAFITWHQKSHFERITFIGLKNIYFFITGAIFSTNY